jgi:hypothetical protein
MLPMAGQYLHTPGQQTYLGTERIRIETLDSASAEFAELSSRVGVKLDVQGYEVEVLHGAVEVLRRAVFIESELLFVELYDGQARFEQLISMFSDAGLRLAWLEPRELDARGALVWGDGVFVRDP